MPLPPGLSFLAKLLPSFLAPPLALSGALLLGEEYLAIHMPRWALVPLCALSTPLVFSTRLWWKKFADRRAARRHGGRLPPAFPTAVGGVDLIRKMFTEGPTLYPGEQLVTQSRRMGNTFCMRILFEDRFFTTEPEHLKIVLATQFNDFWKGGDARIIFGPLLGLGVFGADGELWKFHRAMTRPFFKRDRISDFELFDRHSLEAVAQIKQRLSEGHPVDFQDLASRFSMDASGEFLFGHDSHTLLAGLPYPSGIPRTTVSDDSSKNRAAADFAAALGTAQLVLLRRGALGAAWPLIEFWRDQCSEPLDLIRRFLNPILGEAIERRRRAGGEKLSAAGESTNANERLDREVQEGETLVEHLLNYTEDQTMLRDEILNIAVAGRDTTACLLTFVLYMLTSHPAVLAKLRAEILETVGPSRAPTPEDFREMKYLRAVLNETLRLYPPVPFNMRSTINPVTLPSTAGEQPFYLPARSKVIFSVFVMQRRTDLWGPDAAQWDPERFIDERLHKYLTPNPFIFLPFNAGPRICLGQQFAYHESSFFLVRLLQSFSGISLALDAQPPESLPPPQWAPEHDEVGWKSSETLRVKNHLTLFINGGLWVKMEEAKGDV